MSRKEFTVNKIKDLKKIEDPNITIESFKQWDFNDPTPGL